MNTLRPKTILKHTRLSLQPCSCLFRMHLERIQRIPLVVCICQFRLKMCFNIGGRLLSFWPSTRAPLIVVDEVGLEPTVHGGGRFTVSWGYQFSYTSKYQLQDAAEASRLRAGSLPLSLKTLGNATENRTPLYGMKTRCPNR